MSCNDGVVFELHEDGTMVEVTEPEKDGGGCGNAMSSRERRFFTFSFSPPSAGVPVAAESSSRSTPVAAVDGRYPRGEVPFEILEDGSMIEVDPDANATGRQRRIATLRFADQPLRGNPVVEDIDAILAAGLPMIKSEQDEALFREIWNDCMTV